MGYKDCQDLQDLLEIRGQRVTMELMANLVNKDQEVLPVWTEMLARLDFQGLLVQEDPKEKKASVV